MYLSQERGRTARAARVVRVGDDSSSVLAGLGAPALRCSPGSLAHLRESLPAGTPRVVADETIDRLRRETATRWLWGNEPACTPRPGHTEVGLDRAGRVLWAVPEHGDSPATLR